MKHWQQVLNRLSALALAIIALFAGTAHAQSVKPLKAVASFYPVYHFAAQVVKDIPNIELTMLAPPSGGCLHDYQLLVSDMRKLSEADVFIINGAGMEEYLDAVRRQFPNLSIIDSSQGIELLAGEAHEHEHEEGPAEKEPAPAADTQHAGAQAHDHEHEEAANAHVWLSAANAATMAGNIARGLAAMAPDAQPQLQANAAAYQERLQTLDGKVRELLNDLPRREIVTFHEAFSYFAKQYGLYVAAVVTLEPEQALSPAELADIVKKVRASNMPPLFSEDQYGDSALRAVAQETGAKVYVLDPFVAGSEHADAYEQAMLANAAALKEALSAK